MTAPKLRFKAFDGDWVSSLLGEISDIKTGPFGSTLHQEDYVQIGTPIITVEHLGEIGITNQNLPLVSDEDKLRLKAYVLQENDLAFSRVGSVDRCSIVTKKENGWLFSGRILRVRPNKKIYAKNLMYALKTEDAKYRIRSVAVGQTMPSLNTEILKNFPITLSSSKEEQTKIASFLSAVDEKISQLTQKHSLLSQYKQGMMQKLFSQQIRFKADDGSEFGEWEETKFLNLMDDLWDYRGKTPKKLGMDWGNGEIQSLSALNIKKGFIDFDADCHLGSENLYKIWMNKGDLEKNDIIFTMEAPLGNVALIPDNRKYILSQRVVCFKTNKELVFNPFLFQLILSDQFQNRVDELATGTTAKGINQKSMQKIEVKIPCLEEQIKIANFLSVIDQKIEVVAQQIEQAKTWKKGLLQQMFV